MITRPPVSKPEYERFVFRDEKEPEFVTPKEVDPYEFYCSNCNENFQGYSVYCPKCGVRMKLLTKTISSSQAVNQGDKNKCVLCHSEICPVCKSNLDKCHEECPFCERKYHEHCWINTIKTTGKCSFCLEAPPPEMLHDLEKRSNY